MNAEPPPDKDATAPRRRVLSRNLIRVLTINAVFGAVIGVGLYAAGEQSAMFLRWAGFSGAGGVSSAGDGDGQSGDKGPAALRKVKVVGAAALDPNDPVLRFAETRIGQVLFASVGNDNCQRLLFDNRNGNYYDTPGIFCGQTPEQSVESETPARLLAISQSLKQR
jgi:hypothetical protein